MMSTVRAARPGRDRTAKSHSQNTPDGANTKNQPTPEQVRVAQMYSDGVKHGEDPELFKKITQAMELTGRTTDDALVALHDCDNDLNRAVERLLENVNEGEWKEAGKKRRSQVSSKPSANSSSSPNNTKGSTDRSEDGRSSERVNDRGSRGGRRGDNRAPPRFRGRGRENDENEKNRSESGSRGFERGRGRGRGMRGMTRGRGRGRGGISSSSGGFGMPNQAEDKSYDRGPQIDVWTNETAENADKENIGAWGDIADDWSTEDWTGSLEESKVFTQSVSTADTNGGFDSLPTSDAVDSSMFSSDSAPQGFGETNSFRQPAVGTPPSMGSTMCGQPTVTSCNSTCAADQNSIGQRVDLSEMFAKPAEVTASSSRNEFMSNFGNVVTDNGPTTTIATSEAVFMSQYAREATESIKNAVGIGSSSPRTSAPTMAVSSETPPPSHAPPSQTSPSHHHHHHQNSSPPHGVGSTTHRVACSRQRTKLPPPSKIPASAVVMPGDMNFDLDVQFGNWDVTPSDANFSFGDVTQPAVTTGLCNSYTNSTNSIGSSSQAVSSLSSSRLVTTSDTTSSEVTSSLTSSLATPSAPQQTSTTGMFPSAPTTTTPPKEYPKMSASPLEQMAFTSSQSDRKSNNYSSQRTNQSTGSLSAGKPASAQLSSYGTSAYTSAPYQSSYKSTSLNYGVSATTSQQQQQPYSYASSQPQQQTAALYPTQYHDTSSGYQEAPASAYQTSSVQYTNHATSSSTYSGVSKLSDSLNKMAVGGGSDDVTSPPQTNGGYESVAPSAGMSSSTATTTASHSIGNSSSSGVSGASSHGIATSMSTTVKSATTKPPPNLPPGVPPVMGHNYMIGQPGAMPFPFNVATLQTPMYTYEDLQMLQQRLTMPGYYDMSYQPPTTLPTAVRGDPTTGFPPVPYSADGKLGRVDAQSPVQATPQRGPTGAAPNAAQQSGHQQFMNPTIPPGYNYYYPAGSLLHGGYPYQPALYPMPSVTNAHGGGTTATSQFQKPAATYGSHAYGAGAQSADFGKPYGSAGGLSQSQQKGSVSSVPSSSSDLTGPGSGYSKAHTQTFDKSGFHGATPPPFGLPLASGTGGGGAGTQGGPLGGAPTGYGAPYGVPMMTHQPHSQMLHHHLQQDSVGSHGGGGAQPPTTQPKPGVNKGYSNAYWGSN